MLSEKMLFEGAENKKSPLCRGDGLIKREPQ